MLSSRSISELHLLSAATYGTKCLGLPALSVQFRGSVRIGREDTQSDQCRFTERMENRRTINVERRTLITEDATRARNSSGSHLLHHLAIELYCHVDSASKTHVQRGNVDKSGAH